MLKTIFVILICITAAAYSEDARGGSHPRTAAPTDIKIIVAGQSNAVGYAADPAAAPEPGVLAWDPSQQKYIEAVDPLPFWETRIPEGPGLVNGAWIDLGHRLRTKFTRVLFTGGGVGGQPISYWDVGQPGWTALSANIIASGRDASFMIWSQGDGDQAAIIAATINWPAKMTDLANRVRALVNNPKLPILVCQSSDNADVTVRNAQYAYTLTDDNAFVISCQGFPIGPDAAHYTSVGYDMLASVCAKHILSSAWFLSPQGLYGIRGDTGPKGDKGDKGDQGIPGVDGSNGVSPELPAGMMFMIDMTEPKLQAPFMLIKEKGIRIKDKVYSYYRYQP